MKKLLIILILMFSVFSIFLPVAFWTCTYNEGAKIWTSLNNCLSNSKLVNWKDVTVKAWGWFETQIKKWTTNIALYLWIFAVGSIVVWGLMLTLSAWEEEKIKKAKDIVKWWIIWFVWIITASAIISIIVRLVYSI